MRCPALLALVLIANSSAAALAQATSAPAQPASPAEADGRRSLFDGKTTAGWRAYKKDAFPAKGWEIEDGALKCTAGGGDIITADQFADVDFTFEWKVSEKANSGVMFRVTEKYDATWQTGPEYQILDDAGNGTAPTDAHSAGALYELAPPAAGKQLKPVGAFNQSRILVCGGIVQHWLNGVKIVDVSMDGKDWADRIANSKFKAFDGFGVQPRGHIALQDHGNVVWFRKLEVRDLSADASRADRIFNGADLTGWRFVSGDQTPAEKVWSVKDGVLICKGEPTGYLRTEKSYKDYVLRLQWRWNPETKKTGNSGVLLGCSGPDGIWPACIEAQLQHESAGDFWNLGNYPIKTDPARNNGKNTKKSVMAEKPVGEWNEYVITVHNGRIVLRVNGQLVNEATDVPPLSGPIGLQSEGTEIQFRNIRLTPLD